ncbi:MAG TPA: GspH/FimT family pseudopilin [Burkholderiales bacterium]|nr:GspH/FimT family pseudopilin [Burkholderiales bacterium]
MQTAASPRDFVRGFTLIEMVAVMAVTLILIALAAPSFRDLMRSQTIKTASFNLVSSLVRARSEAVTRNANVTVQPVSGSWLNGWVITLADGTSIGKADAPSGITITGPASVTFNGNGAPTAVPAPFAVTASGALTDNQRCVRLNLSGRPQLKKGSCT